MEFMVTWTGRARRVDDRFSAGADAFDPGEGLPQKRVPALGRLGRWDSNQGPGVWINTERFTCWSEQSVWVEVVSPRSTGVAPGLALRRAGQSESHGQHLR
jgi:hypothetical protein